ncbi:helix-turn-helix transcriptional regulator [Clostridium butyricum]|uniref:helix-turn-helix transcriptional regulator n=1 Tax=Clostridium butyricum TaxID=1492 RepID=UPI003466E45B
MNTKIARIKAGLTQKELGMLAGTSNVTIVKIEKGDIDSVKLGTLKSIAKALNTTVMELFFTDEQ